MERGFQITVRGQLEAQFTSVFGPAEIEADGRNTLVRGHYCDQSNLDGVLAYFRDLGMELVSVETWDEPTTETHPGHEPTKRESEQ